MSSLDAISKGDTTNRLNEGMNSRGSFTALPPAIEVQSVGSRGSTLFYLGVLENIFGLLSKRITQVVMALECRGG